MMISRFIFSCLLFFLLAIPAYAQQTLSLTLDEAIDMASTRGPDARIARLGQDASRWNFRAFEAEYNPSLRLFANAPGFLRSR